MPKVGGKKFPYTAKGRDQAKAYAKRLKKKKKVPGRPLTAAEKRYHSGRRVA